MTSPSSSSASTFCRERIAKIERKTERIECVFANGSTILISPFLATQVSVGDEISFPLATQAVHAGTEIYVREGDRVTAFRDVYQAPIGYVSRPRQDKREGYFVIADVLNGQLGISSIRIDSETLRASHAPVRECRALERAFNILAHEELRACYDALLKDSLASAVFPYGGFGSILVVGERSRTGDAFFTKRILGFLPEQRHRHFRAPDAKYRSVVKKARVETENGEPAMQLNVPPDLETLINKRLSGGGYTSIEDVLRRALEAQDAEESWTDEERRALSAHIEEGYLQAERGELVNGAQARHEIQAMNDDRRLSKR